jgi:hypothetical protein
MPHTHAPLNKLRQETLVSTKPLSFYCSWLICCESLTRYRKFADGKADLHTPRSFGVNVAPLGATTTRLLSRCQCGFAHHDGFGPDSTLSPWWKAGNTGPYLSIVLDFRAGLAARKSLEATSSPMLKTFRFRLLRSTLVCRVWIKYVVVSTVKHKDKIDRPHQWTRLRKK